MSPLEFLRLVWPPKGLYCIAVPLTKGFEHFVYDTIEAAAAKADELRSTKDVYFATHVMKNTRIWNERHHADKTTKEWVAGWSVRTHENMRACRVLFFDLDVGEGTKDKPKYATQRAAVSDILSFVAKTKLPKPTLVSSGYGVHVYWLLDRELESASEWVTIAARLKQLANAHGVRFDPSRTTDQSSVLRVAGTLNIKKGTTKPVELKQLGDTTDPVVLAGKINDALEDVDLTPKAAVVAKVSDHGLGSNTAKIFEGTTPTMVEVIQACPQIARIAAEKGKNSDYGEWWATLGVVKFVQNGLKHFHTISSGHPGYNPAAAEAKFDQWRTDAPTTCERMEAAVGPTHALMCHGCPFLKQNTNPVHAARLLAKAPPPPVEQVVDDEVLAEIAFVEPPMPYKRLPTGGIGMLIEGKEGKQFQVQIYPYDFYPLMRSSNAGKESEQHLWRVHLPFGIVKDFSIEAGTFVDAKALRIRLANNGVYPPDFEKLWSYMSAYIQELQKQAHAQVQHNHLGWSNDKSAFILPTRVVTGGETDQLATLSRAAVGTASWVKKRGTFAEQVRLLKFYEHPDYVARRFFIMGGLGSPLFYMTGHHGVIIHATGETGASKSTSLYTAASFWGEPEVYALNCNKSGSTLLAKAQRLDALSSLPGCLDEVTNMSSEDAKDFALGVTQPSPRIRLTRSGEPVETTDDMRYQIVLSTGNVSLQHLLSQNNVAGTAGAVRVFEIMMGKLGVHTPIEAQAYMRGIAQNFGHVGEAFVRVVIQHQDLIAKRVLKTMDMLATKGNQAPEERFWFAGAATTLVASDLASRMNVLHYNTAEMQDWFLTEQLPKMRGMIAQELQAGSSLALLTEYLEHINGKIVRTTKVHGGIQSNTINEKINGELLAHYHEDLGVIYVLKAAFRMWCERKSKFAQKVLSELHTAGVVLNVDTRRMLGEGTSLAKARSWCFSVNLKHPEMAALTPTLVAVNGVSPIAKANP